MRMLYTIKDKNWGQALFAIIVNKLKTKKERINVMYFPKFLSLISRSILLIFVVATFWGCAVKGTGPLFVSEEPMDNKAIVFHYRTPSFVGSAMQYDVLSNGTPLTRIGNGGFFKEIVEPGPTIYAVKSTTSSGGLMIIGEMINNARQPFIDTFTFIADASKVYYLRWSVDSQPKIDQIPEEEALRQIKSLRSFLPAQMDKE